MSKVSANDLSLVRKLTDKSLDNEISLITFIRDGVNSKKLRDVFKVNALESMWSFDSSCETLSKHESELSVRILRVFAHATEVFSESAKAITWMTASNTALGGNTPLDLLDTGFGYETVVDTLRRIEYGVFS